MREGALLGCGSRLNVYRCASATSLKRSTAAGVGFAAKGDIWLTRHVRLNPPPVADIAGLGKRSFRNANSLALRSIMRNVRWNDWLGLKLSFFGGLILLILDACTSW